MRRCINRPHLKKKIQKNINIDFEEEKEMSMSPFVIDGVNQGLDDLDYDQSV